MVRHRFLLTMEMELPVEDILRPGGRAPVAPGLFSNRQQFYDWAARGFQNMIATAGKTLETPSSLPYSSSDKAHRTARPVRLDPDEPNGVIQTMQAWYGHHLIVPHPPRPRLKPFRWRLRLEGRSRLARWAAFVPLGIGHLARRAVFGMRLLRYRWLIAHLPLETARQIPRDRYYPRALLTHMAHRGYYGIMRLGTEDDFMSLLAQVDTELYERVDTALGLHASIRQANNEYDMNWGPSYVSILERHLAKTPAEIPDSVRTLANSLPEERKARLKDFAAKFGLTPEESLLLGNHLWPIPYEGVAYHGTTQPALEGIRLLGFQIRRRPRARRWAGDGVYLYTSLAEAKKSAAERAEEHKQAPAMVRAEITLRNPRRFNTREQVMEEIRALPGYTLEARKESFLTQLKDQGYDGLVIQRPDGTAEVIAYDPRHQIRILKDPASPVSADPERGPGDGDGGTEGPGQERLLRGSA